MDLPEPDDRLNSWKEIAGFLGRTVRTVQRWEKHDDLPLRRGGPGRRGAVCASKHEISVWWNQRRATLEDAVLTGDGERQVAPTIPVGRRIGLIAALAVLVIAVVTALPLLRREDPSTGDRPRLGRVFAASTSEGRTDAFIPLNAQPSGLALDASGTLAYVALSERSVAVVDLHARRIVDRLDVTDHPTELALSPDGARLVINGEFEIVVYDLRRRALRRFRVDGGIIRDLHVSRDGRLVWLTLAQGGLKILDLDTGRLDTLATIGCPMFLTAAPLSRRIFVSYQCGGPGGRSGHDAIEIVDEITRKPILAGAKLPLVGSRLALSPDEQHLWADTHDACGTRDYDQAGCPAGSGPVVHVLRADTLDPLLTLRAPGIEFGTVPLFFPDGTRLVLAGDRLTVVDRALGTAHESIEGVQGLAEFSADGRFLVIPDATNDRLRIFEVAPPADAWTLREAATHWSGDGTANDVVGGTHPVTIESLRFEPGRYGQAFSFDAGSKGVGYGRRLNVNIADDRPVAYVAWIKPKPRRSGGGPQHIASRTGPSGWKWSLSKEGRLAFCLESAQPDLSCAGDGVQGQTVLQRDRWSHVAVVRTADTLTLFVDGRADGSVMLTANSPLPPDDPSVTPMLRLGAGPDGAAPFHGLIDEAIMFRRPLSADDLVQVMRATSFAGK